MPADPPRKPRGFAYLALHDPDRQRAIAAKGGAAHRPETRSFSRDPALASRAGAIGGSRSKKGRKDV